MRRILIVVLVLIGLGALSIPNEQESWGAVAEGVRLGLTVGPQSGSEQWMEISVRNVADRPQVLRLGSLIGARFAVYRFRVILITADGKSHIASYTGEPAVVGGRMDPLFVPLGMDATYSVRLPLAKYSVVGDRDIADGGIATLAELHLLKSHLCVELYLPDGPCGYYSASESLPSSALMATCWKGKAVSNLLPFRR